MIYIATHKMFEVPKIKDYVPLQVGAENKQSLGFLQDNVGNNISYKNSNYCELTGLYWIWKNVDDPFKGLVHYRRYFGKSNLSCNINDIYTYDEMVFFLNDVDIVLPYVEHFKQNAKEEIIIECCTEVIFYNLEKIINEKYPEYSNDFKDIFSNNKCTLFNMLFCKAEVFDSYCEWLFDVLFELEKYVDLTKLNAYQKRLYGFLSERLLNVWVKHNKLRVKNVNIINVEMGLRQRIQLIRRRITNQMIFSLTKR